MNVLDPFGLYRPEALDHAQRRLDGEVVLFTPLSSRFLTSLAIGCVLLGLTFASTATYSSKENVSGWVAPSDGLIQATAIAGGRVTKIYVKEGQRVSAGEPIAALRQTIHIKGGDAGDLLAQQIAIQLDASENMARISKQKLIERKRTLQKNLAVLQDEQSQANTRVALTAERQKLAEDAVERARPVLEAGDLSKREFDNFRAAALTAAQEASQAKSAAIDISRQSNEMETELLGIPSEIASAEAQAAQARATLSQEDVNNSTKRLELIVAPVSGQVAVLNAIDGQVLAPESQVAIILPPRSKLLAELYIPSRSIGLIKIGDGVQLMYAAFPYQVYGTGRGTVVSVSGTVISPNQINTPGLRLDQPVFRARVAIDRQFVSAYGKKIPLQPGMLLTADIITSQQTFAEWLFDPVYAASRR